MTVKCGDPISIPTSPSNANNYKFTKWTINSAQVNNGSDSTYDYTFGTPITGNITLYANGVSSNTTYTLTFNGN